MGECRVPVSASSWRVTIAVAVSLLVSVLVTELALTCVDSGCFLPLPTALTGNSHGSSRVGSTTVRDRIDEAVSARVGGDGRIGHAGGGEGHGAVGTLGNSSDSKRVAIGVVVIGQDRNGDGLSSRCGGGIGVGHGRIID